MSETNPLAANISLGIALAACVGLRAWLPMLMLSILARAGYAELHPSYAFLASERALWVLAIATVVEILGDMIPAVDHILDHIHTVVRPALATAMASAMLVQISDPLAATVIGLIVGAPVASIFHVAKAKIRFGSTHASLGLANPVLSLLENGLVSAGLGLAWLAPWLAGPLVVLISAGLLIFLVKAWKIIGRRLMRVRTGALR